MTKVPEELDKRIIIPGVRADIEMLSAIEFWARSKRELADVLSKPLAPEDRKITSMMLQLIRPLPKAHRV